MLKNTLTSVEKLKRINDRVVRKSSLITSTKNFTNFTSIARKINQYITHVVCRITQNYIGKCNIQLNKQLFDLIMNYYAAHIREKNVPILI